MKKKGSGPVPRGQLICLVQNTHDDVKFFVGFCTAEDGNFLKGLCRYDNKYVSKDELLAEIFQSDLEVFPSMRNYPDNIVLSPKLYASRRSINRGQRFPPTPAIEGYLHVAGVKDPYYEMYFFIDHVGKTITFALAGRKKTLPLEEYSGWVWKLTKKEFLCQTSKNLEDHMLSPLWNPIIVMLGRRALGIEDAI